MNNIAIARGLAQMTQEALASQIDSRQEEIARWETGARTPTMDKFLSIAKALNVSLSWLCGQPDYFALYDAQTGVTYQCPIISSLSLWEDYWESDEPTKPYGALLRVDHPDLGPVSVIVSGGIAMTPTDWQAFQPATQDDVDNVFWMDMACMRSATAMFNGLPRFIDELNDQEG